MRSAYFSSIVAMGAHALAQDFTASVVATTDTAVPFTAVATAGAVSSTAGTLFTITSALGSVVTTTTAAASTPSGPSFLEVASTEPSVSTLVDVLQEDRFKSLFDRLSAPGAAFTCLAPTNEAFDAFLASEDGSRFRNDSTYATQLLEYHILLGVIEAGEFGEGLLGSDWYRTFLNSPDATPGVAAQVGLYNDGGASVKVVSGYLNEATVLQANIPFGTGYIHTIDQVLTIPPSLQNILVNGGYTSLLGALGLSEQAGLGLSALQDVRYPTIFAPTNEAFQNIGSALAELDAQQVADVLRYHIVPGRQAFASDLADGQQLDTLAGEPATVTIRDGDSGPMIFINGAMVVQPNLVALEGVVHGIDQVLNANNMSTPADGVVSGAVQYQGATSAESPPLTSGQPTPTTEFSMPDSTGGSSSGTSSSMPEQQTGNKAGRMAKMPGALGLGVVAAAALL